VSRRVGPFFLAPGNSHFFQTFNRNKRSITLNLKHPKGAEILRALVKDADALFNNLRGDLPEKLGLTYAALQEVNPRLVCAHLSAYGRDGPRKAWPGYDYLMQAEAGYLSLTGEPDGPPARFGLSVVDMMTGLMSVFGLVSGIVGARESGKGGDVDVSLFDTALHNLSYLAAWYLNGGHVQGRETRSAHPSLTPSQLYRTRDGWIFIMCNKEKFWPILSGKLGHPEWGEDPRFRSFEDRLRHRDLLTGLLDGAFMTRDTADWIAALGGEVPAAPVLDVKAALDNPFVAARGAVAGFDDPGLPEPVRMLKGPVRIGGEALPTRAAPALGADTADVLARLGITGDALAALKRDGVI
jgi:crotonobetainyl-CoA:carnitine CoA-transferase CaiB-like acyl-CoA transferase